MYRVWRYRGGRDGHETLQQFMNFLGREKEKEADPVTYGESSEIGPVVGQEGGAGLKQAEEASSNQQKDEGGRISETTDERLGSNTYAGVVVFCIPIVAETGRGDADLNVLQVWEWGMQY